MSSESSPRRLLVIEPDVGLAETLFRYFQAQDHDVVVAHSSTEGIALAQKAQPQIILLAMHLPDAPALETFRTLRDMPRTGHIPVMVLAGKDDRLQQNQVLAEGAYDFIEKPLDLDILALRVRNALRRAEREGLTEPRTGLPTGRLLQERLEGLAAGGDWVKIEVAIESFDVFRDLYGFVTANEALRHAGRLIGQLAGEHGGEQCFVGHRLGTETFVIITDDDHGPVLQQALEERLTPALQSFYGFIEREQGYVALEDGAGGTVQRPLMRARIEVERPSS